MPIDDLVGPQAFSPWWAITGAAVIALLAAWVVVVLVLTRHRPVDQTGGKPEVTFSPGADPFRDLRALYLGQVDEASRAFHAQEIDVRELHLRLSGIVRGFAGRRRGVDTTVMTLTDIENLTGAGTLANLIAYYYQPAFSETTTVTGVESVEGARTVISTW